MSAANSLAGPCLADAAWQPAARAGKPPRPVIVPARRRKAVMARPMLLASAAP